MFTPRLLFLVPLIVYGIGAPIAFAYHYAIGMTFRPDALFPFELIGLAWCFAGWRLAR